MEGKLEMSKGTMVALLGGIVAVIAGVLLLVAWWGDFIVVLKGSLGPLLALGGLLVIAIGWSEHQAAREMQKLTAQAPTPTPQPPAETKPTTTQEQKPAEPS